MTSHESSLASTAVCICGDPACAIPFGCCHCGCGGKTELAQATRLRGKTIKDQPRRYIQGHGCIKAYKIPRVRPFKFQGSMCCWISLTRGYRSLVDADLYPDLSKLRWKASIIGKHVYALSKNLAMHREVARLRGHTLDYTIKVDHPNAHTLDNRYLKLRVTTNTKNLQNCVLSVANTSGYKGVTWNKNERKWLARIVIFGKPVIVLRTHSKLKAARAYDEAARKHFGEFACLNFPLAGERGARVSVNANSAKDRAFERRFRSPGSQAS